MNPLPLQVLIWKGIGLPDLLQIFNDDMPADAEILIPPSAYFPGYILKIVFFRLHPVSHPLVCIVITAGFILLKNIGPFPVQRLSQIFQQHLKRLVRSLFHQGNA